MIFSRIARADRRPLWPPPIPDLLSLLDVVVLAYLVLFLALPLGRILVNAALAAGGLASDPGFLDHVGRVTWNAVLLGALTSAISVSVGLVLAVCITKVRMPARRTFAVLLALPLVTPPFISSFATILLLGRTGVITQGLRALGVPDFTIYGLMGLLITHVLHFIPLAYLTIAAGLRVVPRDIEECAASLGSSTGTTLRRVVLPYVAPHVLMAAALVFLSSFGDVGAPLLVGGNYRVLAVETYLAFTGFLVEPQHAIMLASWTILLSLAMLFVVRALLQRTTIKHVHSTTSHEYDAPAAGWIALGICAIVTTLLFLPYVVIVISSFGTIWGATLLPSGFTLGNYASVLADPRPLQTSLLLSAAATPILLIGAVGVARMLHEYGRRAVILDYLTLLPFVIPGVVIGIGLITSFADLRPFGLAVSLASTPAILPLAYSIRRLPISMRVMAAGFARIDRSVEECSASLGASRLRTFARITLPQLGPIIVASSAIGFIRIMTELGSTLVLYPPGWQTATVSIFKLVGEGRIAQASAIGVVLVGLVGILAGLTTLDHRRLWRRMTAWHR